MKGLTRKCALAIARGVLSGALNIVVRTQRPYQPVLRRGRTIAAGGRDCDARLQAILPALNGAGVSTVVDHGCAEGYFVRRFAEAGFLTVGVETDIRRIAAAQISLTLDGVQGFGLIHMHLDPERIRRMPVVDATQSLSVLHHGLYSRGVEYTLEMLEAIRERTRRVAIIEMGQSDEDRRPWVSAMPDMGSDPHDWIAGLIEQAGFKQVGKLCKTPAWKSPVKRAVFAAYVDTTR